ncbi:MAG TPA: dolichyl-phosphate beta-glucosyltransferase [Candidatus Binatia bacterium]|nr:dolichyl-phosphate beta-glucosyltransferase [Candidatus Binatia bacterium]
MISIVIPAYNEERRIGASLAAITLYLDSREEDYEVVVVDDGSRDATAAIVEQAPGAAGGRVRLLRMPQNRGKGAAVRAGVLASRGAEVLLSDADLATPIEELFKLRARLAAGCDIVIGSRAVDGSDIRIRQHPVREVMGRTFNAVVRALLVPGIRDTQCGFKLFRGPAARELFAAASVDGFAFDVEILLLARPRYRVAEVPVVWRHVEESKVSPWRDAARMLADVVKLSWRRHGTRGRPE